MNLYDFYVNGVGFRMAQLAYGPDADKWVWSNDSESKPFDTAAECQQDAIAWVRRKENAPESDWDRHTRALDEMHEFRRMP
ncbi:hypothetical protein [Paludisphaera sp.]|uniref:hypothetical protein n=1 Tax=Paludisphaera sp. TaxID=2017432 RepID=UPI00301C3F01